MTRTPQIDEVLEQVRAGLLTPAAAADRLRRLRTEAAELVGLTERWAPAGVAAAAVPTGTRCMLLVGADAPTVAALSASAARVVPVPPEQAGSALADLAAGGSPPDAVVWVAAGDPDVVLHLSDLVGAARRAGCDGLRLLFASARDGRDGLWDAAVAGWARSVALEWTGFAGRVLRIGAGTDPVAAVAAESAALAVTTGVVEVRTGSAGREVS